MLPLLGPAEKGGGMKKLWLTSDDFNTLEQAVEGAFQLTSFSPFSLSFAISSSYIFISISLLITSLYYPFI
jgi:hypothetical protein